MADLLAILNERNRLWTLLFASLGLAFLICAGFAIGNAAERDRAAYNAEARV
jgi:hypothetical protein